MFLQIGALIPLGIFAATIVSRLRFLGVDAAGPNIALFGGFMTVFNSMAAGFTTWAMIASIPRFGPAWRRRIVEAVFAREFITFLALLLSILRLAVQHYNVHTKNHSIIE